MDRSIKDFIARCPDFQLDRTANIVHSQPPLRPLPPVALPFERWGIDFVQNLPLTKSGKRHIITTIDFATKWVIAKAVKETCAERVAQFFYNDMFMNFGSPFEPISGRGTVFWLEDYESMRRCKTNGMVERMHSMLGHSITTLTTGRPERCDKYLPQALFAIRVRTHSVTKMSPFFMLYGVHPRLPGDTNPVESDTQPLDELEKLEEQGEINARTFEEMGNARRAAYERSRVQAEAMRHRYNVDPNAPDYYFTDGDWVKMKHYGKTKFEFDWTVPYRIVDVGFPGTYWLMTPAGRRFDSTVNQSDRAPWLEPVEKNRSFFHDGTLRSEDIMDEDDDASSEGG